MNVLIVEDDPMVSRLNAQYLARLRDTRLVGQCRDAVSALARLRADTVDLVLLDVYLGRRSGLEIAEWLAANRPGVDIILITAASELETVQSARRLGVSDYLVKPFAFERFAEAVDTVTRRRRALARLHGPADQQALDAVFRAQPRSAAADDLPKGLTAPTLARVVGSIIAHDAMRFSTDEIAEAAGMSRVSLRKYLRHLVSRGLLSEEFAYGAVGRPAFVYRCLDSEALHALQDDPP
ncbi:response regulator [Salinisphaera sp. Q1T1-3]|uniref:response regulator n=1 Tax=Salinisphaera sp. Q1T1-3 TaxID=2321229 RepID=UPI000E741D61|nr:response regulator [Salinisphaera sp. Q1T1-3]RJS95250.1 response regulator [Salinisphaera sp. Q1T1-3]